MIFLLLRWEMFLCLCIRSLEGTAFPFLILADFQCVLLEFGCGSWQKLNGEAEHAGQATTKAEWWSRGDRGWHFRRYELRAHGGWNSEGRFQRWFYMDWIGLDDSPTHRRFKTVEVGQDLALFFQKALTIEGKHVLPCIQDTAFVGTCSCTLHRFDWYMQGYARIIE